MQNPSAVQTISVVDCDRPAAPLTAEWAVLHPDVPEPVFRHGDGTAVCVVCDGESALDICAACVSAFGFQGYSVLRDPVRLVPPR